MKKSKKGLIIVFSVIIGVIALAFITNYLFPQSENDNNIKQEETKDYITLEDFNKINNGMSYEEVKNIIGCDGTVASDTQIADNNMVIYYWYGKDKISNANFSFQNDKLINKTQIGLE